MSTPIDLLDNFLVLQAQYAKKALSDHRKNREIILKEANDPREPHIEEEDEEDAPRDVEMIPLAKKKPKKKKLKKKVDAVEPTKKRKRPTVEGPCEGRIWLEEPEKCPGPEAKRGRTPEASSKKFCKGRWNRKNHTFCVSCKNELIGKRAKIKASEEKREEVQKKKSKQ